MKKEYEVMVESKRYQVFFSDEKEALLAAKAAGRAVLGLWDRKHPQAMPSEIPYLVEEEEQITEVLLERLVRRRLSLPWIIAETERLRIREFTPGDWENLLLTFPAGLKGTKGQGFLWEECPAAFADLTAFLSYIHCQYPFYEYGLWAVEEKEQRCLIGGCGFWDSENKDNGERGEGCGKEEKGRTEIGYWIGPLFQNKGYGTEAVKAVVDYAVQTGKVPVYANLREENIPSRKLLEKLKFIPVRRPEHSEARRLQYRYVPYY